MYMATVATVQSMTKITLLAAVSSSIMAGYLVVRVDSVFRYDKVYTDGHERDQHVHNHQY